MTDPYLLSANDDAPVPTALADGIHELARRMRVPRTMLEDMPPETLDRMEQFVSRREADEEAWGDLADSIARKLTAAGFRRHDPHGQRGGFHLSLREDGVILAWSTAEYRDDMVSSFEKTMAHAMHPALEQILQAAGFAARIIPEEEDNGGNVQVTGWQGPGGFKGRRGAAMTRDYIDADVHDPESILRQATRTLDFAKPVAIMMLGIVNSSSTPPRRSRSCGVWWTASHRQLPGDLPSDYRS